MLSKKYYKMIAECIASAESREELAHMLAEKFTKDNHRFKTDTFLQACAVEEFINPMPHSLAERMEAEHERQIEFNF